MTFLKTVFKENQSFADTLRTRKGIRKIVEECYPDNAHFIFELLQNAEDAGASEVSFDLQNDCLIFTHDGTRPFTEKDVRSICDIGESTLSGQIGKFGVGFKSVFAYTETPRIYCRTFNFEIVNLVQPKELTPRPDIGDQTRFEFEFNSPKKPRDLAHHETSQGLRGLSDSTLLFLSNLRVIRWQISNGPQTMIRRIERPNDLIQVDLTIATKAIKSTHWLRYSNKWMDQDQKERSIAVAYSMAFEKYRTSFDESRPLAEQFKIVPAAAGKVFVFFPAAGENSGLYFHVHAPFATDVSRANVKDGADNGPMYERLGRLAASSLHKIRDQGLLTTEVLAVLPNNDDGQLQKYQPICDAILSEMTEQRLVPTLDGQHAAAKQLIRAKPNLRGLLSGLSKADLASIVGAASQDIHWAMDLGGTGAVRERQLLTSLSVRKLEIGEFLQRLDQGVQDVVMKRSSAQSAFQYPYLGIDWLKRQSLEWHQRLYCVLHREIPRPHDCVDPLDGPQIIRLQNMEYGRGSDCFVPTTKVPTHNVIPLVEQKVFSSLSGADNFDAKLFLDRAGAREVEEKDVIKADLDARYSTPAMRLDDGAYLADLKRFMKFLAASPKEVPLFSAAYVFKSKLGDWKTAEEIFLDAPFRETLLSVFHDCYGHDRWRWPLSEWYLNQDLPLQDFIQFAEGIQVQSRLEIVPHPIDRNRHWQAQLQFVKEKWNDRTGISRDRSIVGLGYLLSSKPWTLDKSKLIWQTMCHYANDKEVLTAEYRPNPKATYHKPPSQLVESLSRHPWIPQDGIFVKPANASRHKLPPSGFPFDSSHDWLRAIGFGDAAIQEVERDKQESVRNEELRRQRRQAATNLGFPEGAGELLAELAKSGLTIDALKQIVAEHQQCSLPTQVPHNPDRRAELMRSQAALAPQRETEQRSRAVSVGLSEVKREAQDYLRHRYTNPEGKMICQICQRELPFKYQPAGGTETYFFEAVEFLGKDHEHLRQFQNYLALCPLHAAMFQYANNSKHNLRQMFDNMRGLTLTITLAKKELTVYFNETHLLDLRAILNRNVSRTVISTDSDS